MFKVIDMCGFVHDAYGTFLDDDNDIQFILVNEKGEFYKTNTVAGYYSLYETDK